MDTATILSHVDHTLLKPEATWEQIKTLCDEAMEFGCATVCIPPSFVKQAAAYVQGNLKICTVIGFPNGYNTTAAKIFETKDAVENGASEIDMVINNGMVKDRQWDDIAHEIAGIKAACLGRPLKVIIETCLLSDMEKIKLCQLSAKEEVAYVKTSTGFSTGGATREDVALLRENLPASVKVKASGGIRTLEDGQAYLDLGADRLGASALIAEGGESGGHVGELTTMVLVPQVCDATSLPVIAAGGIADGRGVAAAFLLGACGVQMGTRFLSAEECSIHPVYKERILKANDLCTMVTGKRLGHPVRSLRTSFARNYSKAEYGGMDDEALEALGSGALRKAVVEGDLEHGCFLSGQIAAMVHEVQPAADIVRDVIEGAEPVLKGATKWVR